MIPAPKKHQLLSLFPKKNAFWSLSIFFVARQPCLKNLREFVFGFQGTYNTSSMPNVVSIVKASGLRGGCEKAAVQWGEGGGTWMSQEVRINA